jgi:phosphoribosylglycinamide formyltransferase-1|tara:strand:- start:2726 stop:3376 length:651 start_codon:yes stop_codon:yes gene_type:complete
MKPNHCKLAVLISGNGTNLQALIDASLDSNFKVSAVISNNPNSFGLQRAEKNNIATLVINDKEYDSKQAFEQALMIKLEKINPDLIALAGFMRILSPNFVNHYVGKILNIHPSLLPKYTGINTHQRVIEANESEHGVSVHYVTEELDGGPVIVQEKVPVFNDDTPETLATRVAEKEHIIYPKVVSWFAAGRLAMAVNKAYLDQELLPAGGAEIKSE